MVSWLRRIMFLAVVAMVAFVAVRWFSRPREPLASAAPAWPPLEPLTAKAATAVAPSTWVPSDSGSCPLERPIKANDNSGIFHVPGGRFYDRTRAERCYAEAADAIADGYRAAKA